MSIIGESMEIVSNVASVKASANLYIKDNVYKGEGRNAARTDYVDFTHDELQELIDGLVDYLFE